MYRSMNIKSLTVAVSALVLSTSANSALIERLGGLAYYDTDADLTWLADANVAGSMNWRQSMDWAAGLNVSGVDGWRLPDTLQPDASCDDHGSSGTDSGYHCTGSEMGNLFYTVLDNSPGLSNSGPFSNIMGSYWTATLVTNFSPGNAWSFDMYLGRQDYYGSTTLFFNAWAVHDGDIGASAVPVPAAVWLFGSGLIGLIGVARRKKI